MAAIDVATRHRATRSTTEATGTPTAGASRAVAEAGTVTAEHLRQADVVIGLAPEHVAWIRRHQAAVGSRTSTLRHLAHCLSPHPGGLAHRLARLGLATRTVHPEEEIDDPAGGEVDVFVSCARQVVDLVGRLAPRL